ncbi:hypothetical protein [Chitinophaga sp. S165]|uniref:hypothetical protein n=1 Tax=Chitinophaga sp. S165 TaxID=2135462 RepID=UPI000D70C9BC|nr:hypothetical protein [Chitinophaga sp. S165]PWV56894.1 hypothetical protein C7475_1011414 [Chitinophaga sp. S165]
MKIPYIALFALTLVISCKKEDKPEEEISNARYISSVVTTNDSTVYDYNADHTLRRSAQFSDGKTDSANSYIYFLQYTGGMVTGVNFTHNINSANGTPEYSILYNAANQIGTIIPQNGLGYDSIVYNAQGHVSDYYYIQIPRSIKHHMELTWKDDNLVKMVRNLVQFDSYDILTYAYDNSPNMYVHSAALSLTNINDFHYLSKNNVTRIDYDLAGDRDRGLIHSIMFTYTYDTLHYPVKMLSASEFIEHGDTTDYYLEDSARITYLP